MKITIVGMHYSPEPSGNAPYTTGLATSLAARGHNVRVLTGVPHYPEWRISKGYDCWTSETLEGGASVRRLRHFVPRQPTSVKRLCMEASFGGRLLTQTYGSPDVVVAVTPALISSALAFARFRVSMPHVPVGLWMQDLYSAGIVETGAATGRMARGVAGFESRLAKAATGVAVIHERFRRQLVDGLGVPEQRVRVLRNWSHVVPDSNIDRQSARRRMGWHDDDIIALHAGNMGVKQGLENLVNAARLADARQSRVRFIMMGDGNQRPRLQQSGAGVRQLQFVPSLSTAEFREALAAADVLLVNELPGVKEMSVPSKLTSYFASGRPVVAATEPGGATFEEVSASGGGTCVPAGRPEALLDEIEEMAADVNKARALGDAGARYSIDVLSQPAAIDRFEDWLGHLVRSGKRR